MDETTVLALVMGAGTGTLGYWVYRLNQRVSHLEYLLLKDTMMLWESVMDSKRRVVELEKETK